MTKRLTEKQKKEIVKSFKSGKTIDEMSKKFNCCTKFTTIIRNLKKNLGELKYKRKILKKKNPKLKKKKNQNNNKFKKKFI